MKKKKHVPKKGPAADSKKSTRPNQSASSVSIHNRRLWISRVLIAIFIPLLLLGMLEFGLRLAGVGYNPSFFLPIQIAKKAFYITNEKFGYRFFPPALARTPLPLRMAAEKPAGTYRIFLFGESAAQGDPDPSFGAGRYLEVLLRDRYPGTKFEVICSAMTAINSHAILPIAREAARHDGDLWIVYMGNNEMVGPFGAGTVFGQRAPPRVLVKTVLAVKTTRVGQLLNSLTTKFPGNSGAPKTWSGMDMFKNQQLRYDDTSRLHAYQNFRGNLADILQAGHDANVPILLSTVASNLKDCAPFASLHSLALSENQKSDWENSYQAGIALQTNGQYREALVEFKKAFAIDPDYAALSFREGQCELALSNSVDALRDFTVSRDYDALAFRSDTRINQIIRDAAKNAANTVHLVDAVQAVAQASPEGIPGQELFYEHVHLNFSGNYLLARTFADEVAKLLPPVIIAHQKNSWTSGDACDAQLAVTVWDRFRLWQMNFSRVSEAPFTDQLNDVPRARQYMATLANLKSRMNSAALSESRALYENAVAASPEDTLLHENFAQFLNETGDLSKALIEENKVCELLPCFPAFYDKVGQLWLHQGNTTNASTAFNQALALNHDYVPTLNQLGLIDANAGKISEASMYFEHALRENPGFPDTYLNFGFMEQANDHLNEALAHYAQAAALQPNGPAACFNQAVGLAVNHNHDDAINLFKTTLWMQPNFWQAHYLLGLEFGKNKSFADAQSEFQAAVANRPDFARAHFNLGVAYAKQNNWDDAIKEFQTAAQLRPDDSSAREYLEKTQQLKSRGSSSDPAEDFSE